MPWGRLDDSLYDHQKLDDLPTDDESCEAILATLTPAQLVRLASIGLWTRTISWSNRFLTDGHAPRSRIEKLDGSTALADAIVGAGMFEQAAGGYLVHDFLHFNPSRAEVLEKRAEDTKRQAEWRAKKKADKDAKNGHTVSHNVTPSVEPPPVTGGVTPLVTAPHARDSRDAWRSANPGPARPGPDSLERDSSRAGGTQRADIAALKARGFKRVTKAQRAILDEILARHDVTGAAFAAEAIKVAPPGADPLAAAMTADRLWQAAQQRRAQVDDAAWQQEKADERRDAAKLGDPLADPDWMTEPVR